MSGLRRIKERREACASEDQIQCAVMGYLRSYGHEDAVAFHVPNGGHRNIITATKLKAQGVVPGIPDVIVIHDSHLYGLELKRERGGQLSANQKNILARLETAGATVAVARGLDEALCVLSRWELLPKLKL